MTENNTEKAIIDIFEQILGAKNVKSSDSFSSLGGTPFAFSQLTLELENVFGVEISKNEISCDDSVSTIAKIINPESSSFYPVTDSAKFLYDRTVEMNKVGDERIASYNYSFVFKVEDMSIEEIKKAVYKMFNVHTILKAKPILENNRFMIQRRDDYLPDFTVIEMAKAPDFDYLKSNFKPIRLLEDDPIRCEIYHHGKEYFFVIVIHHILLDGYSICLLLNDFKRVFSGLPIASEENSFYTITEETYKISKLEEYLSDKKYYEELLAGTTPLKYPEAESGKSHMPIYGGSFIRIQTPGLINNCKEHQLTPYSVIMAAFLMALERKTGKDDFSIIRFHHGRQIHKTVRTVGCLYRHMPVAYKSNGCKNLWEIAKMLEKQLSESEKHRFIYDCFPELAEKHYVVFNYLVVSGNRFLAPGSKLTDKTTFIGFFEQKYDYANIPLQFVVRAVSDDDVTLGSYYNSQMYSEKQMLDLYALIEKILSGDNE